MKSRFFRLTFPAIPTPLSYDAEIENADLQTERAVEKAVFEVASDHIVIHGGSMGTTAIKETEKFTKPRDRSMRDEKNFPGVYVWLAE
jgi:hypothetical protein